MPVFDYEREFHPPTRDRDRQPAVRAVTAATRPVTWLARGLPMIPQWDAQAAIYRAYLASVFVYRCVQLRAQAVAGLPIRVGADPDNPEDHDPNHPLIRTLTRNPAVGWRQLIAASTAWYDVTGRFAWELDLNHRRQPTRVYPLVAPYVEPIPNVDGGDDWWAGFRYRVADGHQPYRELPPEQVFYAWRPSLTDWREPESLLQAARIDVAVSNMLARYNYHFLLNDARPAAVVITQAFEEEGEFTRFKRDWDGQTRGVENAGRTIFVEAELEDGEGQADATKWLEIKTLGLSQKDAQQAEIYQQEIRNICVAFGVDLSLLGDTSGRTFDNADQAHRNFWELAMLPLLGDLADHINRRLAPLFGDDVLWFDTSRVRALREPSKFQIPVLTDAVGRYVTVNEARAEVGLPPTGRAEDDQLPSPQSEPAPGQGGGVVPLRPAPTPDPDNNDDEDDGGDEGVAARSSSAPVEARPRPTTIPPSVAATTSRQPIPVEARQTRETPEQARQRRAAEWARMDAQARILETTWERELRAHFTQQEQATLDRLTGKRGRQLLRDHPPGTPLETREFSAWRIFDLSFWVTRLRDLARRLYEATTALGVARVAERFPQVAEAWDIRNPAVENYILTRANQLAGPVTDTTYRAIKQAMVDGIMAGEGVAQITTRIQAVFQHAREVRAGTIARTEVISAANGAADLAAGELGPELVAGKEWIATPDHRTRRDHRQADGQVVPMGAPFQVGGFELPYPGWPGAPPHLIVNCRCTIGFLTPAEVKERATPTSHVHLRTALRVLDLVADGVIPPEHVHRLLEVTAA